VEKVIFDGQVLNYFDELVFTFFKKEYFSFPENAKEYVDKIVGFVTAEIFTFPHKKTPKSLQYLGSNYIFFKSNSRTTWYIFFEKRENNFLITGVINNHCNEAKEL
jgi:hypothetical protein